MYKINRNIQVINYTDFQKKLVEIDSSEAGLIQLDSSNFFIEGFATDPPEGYVIPDKFPHCCDWHTALFNAGKEDFDLFPNCCKQHKHLIGQKWFDKYNYMYLPNKIVETISYTSECITLNAKSTDWYELITHYIDYTIQSYGQFPSGFGSPLGLTRYLSCVEEDFYNSNMLNESQKLLLLEYLDKKTRHSDDEKQPDLNQLIIIYKQWLRIFPFELLHLAQLKSELGKSIPIISENLTVNRYTNIASSKLLSKRELINYLNNATKKLLLEVGHLGDFQKADNGSPDIPTIEIISKRHQLRQEALLSKKLSSRTYWKIINQWLKNEKKYAQELLKNSSEDYTTKSFVLNMLDGMHNLQRNDSQEHCINLVRNKSGNRESQTRLWFKNFLSGRYKNANITAEELKGSGHIDLKVFHSNMPVKIIEFKGWWNKDKGSITDQLCKYLTDFENEAYIVMINDLKSKNIEDNYKNIIETNVNYVANSWEKVVLEHTSVPFYKSKVLSNSYVKTIYHFILNVFY